MRKIYNVETDNGLEGGNLPPTLWDTDENRSVQGPRISNLKPGGQVIVLETPKDVVEFYHEMLVAYHTWLQDNTDTFDPMMVTLQIEGGDGLKFEKPYIEDMVMHHLCDEGLPVIVNDSREVSPPFKWAIVSPDNTLENTTVEAQGFE